MIPCALCEGSRMDLAKIIRIAVCTEGHRMAIHPGCRWKRGTCDEMHVVAYTIKGDLESKLTEEAIKKATATFRSQRAKLDAQEDHNKRKNQAASDARSLGLGHEHVNNGFHSVEFRPYEGKREELNLLLAKHDLKPNALHWE